MAQNSQMNKTQRVFMKSFMDSFLGFQTKYYNPQDADDYWDELITEATELIAKFKTNDERQNTLCESLVLAFVKSRE